MSLKETLKRVAIVLMTVAMTMCVVVQPAYAAEYKGHGATLTASFDGKKLSLTATGDLFTEDEIVPGDSISSKVTIKNQTGHDIKVKLVKVDDVLDRNKTKAPDLYEYMTVNISQGMSKWYDGAMKDSSEMSTRQTTVEAGKSIDYTVVAALPGTVGNEAQGAVLDSNWVFEVQMDEPVNKDDEKPTQTVIISVPSKVSISSGINDIYHSPILKIILAFLIAAFVVIVFAYVKSESNKKGGKKNG